METLDSLSTLRVRGGGCAESKMSASDGGPGSGGPGFIQDLNSPSPMIALGTGISVERAIALAQKAGALAQTKRAKDKRRKDSSEWTHFGGPELEQLLLPVEAHGGEAPVSLLDARALIALASDPDGRIVRRQDMPSGAFIDIERLRCMPYAQGMGLRVICISYPWHQPDHPDPSGSTLRLLAKVLQWFVDHSAPGSAFVKGTYAVFLDFCCLHQKDAFGKRTDSEQALFEMALKGSPCISELYSHPHTFLFKITRMPEGYPQGFHFPERFPDGTICTPNKASYYERGWCYCESSIGDLVKDQNMVLDLAAYTGTAKDFSGKRSLNGVIGECIVRRSPPMSPADFAVALEDKSFTSKKADLDAVNSLYERSHTQRFAKAKWLRFMSLMWGDTEVAVLCRTLDGANKAVGLNLFRNAITEVGIRALAACLREGAAPKLKGINIGENPGAESEAAVAELKAAREGLEVWFTAFLPAGTTERLEAL